MKYSSKLVSVTLAGVLAVSSLGMIGAAVADPAPAANYPTQTGMIKVADTARTAISSAHGARVAIFDNKIDQAKTLLDDAIKSLSTSDADLTKLMVAATDEAGATPEFLPIDTSMSMAEGFKPDDAASTALQKAKSQFDAKQNDEALDTLRVAKIDMTIQIALLPAGPTVKELKDAKALLDEGKYFETNLALKAIEDSIVVRSFSIDAIPVQGNS